jgi:hypothetical protein
MEDFDVPAISNTPTLNSFEKNYKGLIIGPGIEFQRIVHFAKIQNCLKLLNFDFSLNVVVLIQTT